MDNSIEGTFYKLNLDYLSVLKRAKEMLDENCDVRLIIDGIVSFWNRKRNKAEHIIAFFGSENCATFNFTGVSTMDVDNGEAIPYLMCGKRFIYDDPICMRIQLLSISFVNFDNIKKELDYEICDEIKLIETYGKYISILPIRYYYQPSKKEALSVIEKLFLDLFDKKYKSIEDFYKSNRTIEEVEFNVNKEKIRQIMFTSDEVETDSLEERINKFDISLLANADFDFAHKLYLASFSVLSQSFAIMYSNFACGFTPYLRYSVCMINMTIFWHLYKNTPYEAMALCMAKNCIYSYALYETLDIKQIIIKDGLTLEDNLISSYFFYFYGRDNTSDISKISINKALGFASRFCKEMKLPTYN